jgi:glycosyltransferase involved in cell wall biosynthesis
VQLRESAMNGRPGEGYRVVVLWQRMSGYMHAAFVALRDLGVDVRVVHRSGGADAPFDERAVTEGLATTSWTGAPDPQIVESILDDADPHAVIVSSWHINAYRRAVRRRRGQTLRVLSMDNQWWATPKQRLGVATSPLLIRPSYDAAFVASERSADFAHRLGFSDERVIRNLNACDHERFAAVADDRGSAAPERAFVFVGRLVAEKGIDVLAEGYRRYHRMVDDPWPLLVSGAGAGAAELEGVDGVELLGFVQPADLPALLARSGCLVLPSRFEPWGVVIQEAAAAGLAVVCTWVCGASGRLVVDGYNGRVIESGDADDLARALVRISTSTDEERRAMASASRSLADQYTPQRWATHLLDRIGELREQLGLASPDPEGDAALPDGEAGVTVAPS